MRADDLILGVCTIRFHSIPFFQFFRTISPHIAFWNFPRLHRCCCPLGVMRSLMYLTNTDTIATQFLWYVSHSTLVVSDWIQILDSIGNAALSLTLSGTSLITRPVLIDNHHWYWFSHLGSSSNEHGPSERRLRNANGGARKFGGGEQVPRHFVHSAVQRNL